MKTLLAIDTSTEACSVALSVNNETREIFSVIPRMHSQKVLPAIQQLLEEAGINKINIDAIAFGRGPGSFTGIRIATAITQGLAFSLKIPIVPISSLAALAQQAIRKYHVSHIIAAIDARMGEVYWGKFIVDASSGKALLQGKEHISAPEDIAISTDDSPSWYGIGSGWEYAQHINVNVASFTKEAFPHAQDIINLAYPLLLNQHTISAEMAVPVYLRNNVAKRKAERKKST